MIFVAITMLDGSVRRMQVVDGADVDECVTKTPWAENVASYREAKPEEFPADCTWRDVGGKIVGDPIAIQIERDPIGEIDALKAALVAKGTLTVADIIKE